LLKYQPLI